MLFMLLISFCVRGYAQVLPAQNHNSKQVSATRRVSKDEIVIAIRENFGDSVIVDIQHKPYYLLGDFNGDGLKDIAVVVKTGGSTKGLAGGVKVLNPWLESLQEKNGANSISDLALVIIHSWNVKPTARFLLLDSVFEGGELKIYSAALKRKYGLKPPTVRGRNLIYTSSEDAGGIIYWDGRTYLWSQQGD